MSTEIILTVGNGYRCGCCRQTHTREVYASSFEQTVNEIFEVAKYNDFDVSIYRIIPGDQNEEPLDEDAIMEGVSKLEDAYEHQKEVRDLENKVKGIEAWFTDLEKTKASKQAELEATQAKLQEARNNPLANVKLPK